MKKINFSLVVTVVLLSLILSTQIIAQSNEKKAKIEKQIKYPYKFKFEGNPLVSYISSTDPDVNVWDDEVWMYCSQDFPRKPGEDHPYYNMDGYHAFSSKDLKKWTDHGEVIHSRDLSWGKPGWMWAPASARKNGKYYLYYPHRADSTKVWSIGVAVANHPAGPFKDIGKPIEGIKGMDPKIFIDDDGTPYIYCNVGQVARLKENMIELAEKPRKLSYAPKEVLDDAMLRLGEGPYMHKKDGVYYYSYSNPKNQINQGFYGMSNSPYGPFEWKGPFSPAIPNAQDHHSIIQFKGQWYYFYHVNTPQAELDAMGWKGIRRITCFDRFYHNPDGTLMKVEHPESNKKK
jgi:beta-xylosidase